MFLKAYEPSRASQKGLSLKLRKHLDRFVTIWGVMGRKTDISSKIAMGDTINLDSMKVGSRSEFSCEERFPGEITISDIFVKFFSI